MFIIDIDFLEGKSHFFASLSIFSLTFSDLMHQNQYIAVIKSLTIPYVPIIYDFKLRNGYQTLPLPLRI